MNGRLARWEDIAFATVCQRTDSRVGVVPLNLILGTHPMPDKPKSSQRQVMEFIPDFLGEDRHEFVAKLAYKLWEERGRPFGSPDVDWFAAEKAMYASLVASGLVIPAANDLQNMEEKIYS